jgi:signal transduction histidine kinase
MVTPSKYSSNREAEVAPAAPAEALERLGQELGVAAEVAEQLNAILDAGLLLNEVARLLPARFGLQQAQVYLVDGTKQELILQASSGPVGQHPSRGDHAMYPGTQQASMVACAARDRRSILAIHASAELRSELAVPMLAGGQVLGVLYMQDHRPWRFDYDQHIFSMLAGQVALMLQNARLREGNRLKSEFLVNMSRELRAPLFSICGYAEAMLMGFDGQLEPEALKDVQGIYDSSQNLLRPISQIDDVLDLAKTEAGRLTLSFEEEGSAFTVRLPIECPEAEKAPIASSDGQSSH